MIPTIELALFIFSFRCCSKVRRSSKMTPISFSEEAYVTGCFSGPMWYGLGTL